MAKTGDWDPVRNPIDRNIFVLGATLGTLVPKGAMPKTDIATPQTQPVKKGDGTNEDGPDTPGQYSGL